MLGNEPPLIDQTHQKKTANAAGEKKRQLTLFDTWAAPTKRAQVTPPTEHWTLPASAKQTLTYRSGQRKFLSFNNQRPATVDGEDDSESGCLVKAPSDEDQVGFIEAGRAKVKSESGCLVKAPLDEDQVGFIEAGRAKVKSESGWVRKAPSDEDQVGFIEAGCAKVKSESGWARKAPLDEDQVGLIEAGRAKVKSAIIPEVASKSSLVVKSDYVNSCSNTNHSDTGNAPPISQEEDKENIPTDKKIKRFEQLHLDIGQKDLITIPINCSQCGMTWIRSHPDDQQIHQRFHKFVLRGIDFLVSVHLVLFGLYSNLTRAGRMNKLFPGLNLLMAELFRSNIRT
jgi:hypothetical protein